MSDKNRIKKAKPRSMSKLADIKRRVIDRHRRMQAIKRGLPETASWYKIIKHDDNLDRIRRTKECGLT